MQLTLNNERILDVTSISGEDLVEITLSEVNPGSQQIGERMLATGITTKHLRTIADTLIAFSFAVEAEANAENSVGEIS